MRATPPYPDIPGDNREQAMFADGADLRERIMARSGDIVGFTSERIVWRFGFLPDSEAAHAYGVAVDDGEGFVWLLATRKTGKVIATTRGAVLNLPEDFRKIIEGGERR